MKLNNDYYDDLLPHNGLVIGEIACGHEGDIVKAKRLVDAVFDGGAPFVKFQIFTTEERALPGSKEWAIFEPITLSSDAWFDLVAYAREKSLFIIADVFWIQ